MTTVVIYKDGHTDDWDGAPSIDVEDDDPSVTIINDQSECISDAIPLRNVRQVIFEV